MSAKNTVDYVIECFDKLGEGFRTKAEELYELDPQSAAANTFVKCAGEIQMLADGLIEQLKFVTPEQYAELNRVTKQTVRRWCRSGKLQCFEDERGLLIPRHAQVNPRHRLDY